MDAKRTADYGRAHGIPYDQDPPKPLNQTAVLARDIRPSHAPVEPNRLGNRNARADPGIKVPVVAWTPAPETHHDAHLDGDNLVALVAHVEEGFSFVVEGASCAGAGAEAGAVDHG